MQGKLIIFSAPSGSGKTTIVKELLKNEALNLYFSISAASREKRHTETHGVDYYFLSPEEFRTKVSEDAFLEWEEVYEDKYYGTLKSEVERLLDEGKNVIFDVDVVGGLNIKKYYTDKALAVFVQPPSVAELERRLKARATDSAETIQKRIDKAEYELSFADKFDVIVVNDDLAQAIKETVTLVGDFIK
jgi:guanylate kinase